MSVQTHRFEAPAGGLNTEAAPDYLAKDEAPYLENLLPRTGKAVMRGPFYDSTNTIASPPLEDDFMPWVLGDEFLIQSGSPTTAYTNTFGANTFTSVALSDFSYFPGLSWTSLAGNVYGVNKSQDALLRWPGSTTVVKLAHIPTAAPVAVRSYLQRLFLADNGALYWSDPLATAIVDNITSWQDDVSGLTNKILLPDSDVDYVIGLAVVEAGMLVFRQRSILLLSGKTPTTFQITVVHAQVGCLSVAGIAEFRDGCYFASGQGLMWTDGMDANLVSTPITPDIVTFSRTSIRVSRFEDIWLLVCTGDGAIVSPVCKAWLFNTMTGRWISIASAAMVTTASVDGVPLASERTSFCTLVYDGARMWRCFGEVTQPELFGGSSVGYDIHRIAGTHLPIVAEWRSRLARLVPGTKAVIKRLLVDYVWRSDDADSSWQARLVDGTGTDLGTEHVLDRTTTQMLRSRYQSDLYQEVTDVQLRVRSTSVVAAVTQAEIHDCYIEYEVAQQRSNV